MRGLFSRAVPGGSPRRASRRVAAERGGQSRALQTCAEAGQELHAGGLCGQHAGRQGAGRPQIAPRCPRSRRCRPGTPRAAGARRARRAPARRRHARARAPSGRRAPRRASPARRRRRRRAPPRRGASRRRRARSARIGTRKSSAAHVERLAPAHGRSSSAGGPRSTRPTGPAAGEPKATGLVESTLRAWRAAWTSPPNTTSAPKPAASGAAATATASSRFAGPSAPAAEPGRIAPVRTIGRLGVEHEVAEHRRLLERVGAVRDDHAHAFPGRRGRLAGDVQDRVEGQVGAGRRAELTGAQAGHLAQAGDGGHERIGVQGRHGPRAGHRDRAARGQDEDLSGGAHEGQTSRNAAFTEGGQVAGGAGIRVRVRYPSRPPPVARAAERGPHDDERDPAAPGRRPLRPSLRARRVRRRDGRAAGQRAHARGRRPRAGGARQPRAPRRRGRRRRAPATAPASSSRSPTRSSARSSTSSCPSRAATASACASCRSDPTLRRQARGAARAQRPRRGPARPRLARRADRRGARRRHGQPHAPARQPAVRRAPARASTTTRTPSSASSTSSAASSSWPRAPTSTRRASPRARASTRGC